MQREKVLLSHTTGDIILSFSRELMHGIPVFDENGNRLGESKIAAKSAITQVVFSRIMMATPGMSMY